MTRRQLRPHDLHRHPVRDTQGHELVGARRGVGEIGLGEAGEDIVAVADEGRGAAREAQGVVVRGGHHAAAGEADAAEEGEGGPADAGQEERVGKGAAGARADAYKAVKGCS